MIQWTILLLRNVYFINKGMDNKVYVKTLSGRFCGGKKAHLYDIEDAEKADYE